MTLWIAFGVVALVALAMLLVPLLRRDKGAASRASYDMQVYRDQLAEVERDAARGVIGGAEAEAARTEIARRLLAADEEARADTSGRKSGGRAVIAALAVTLCVPALAFGIYLVGGAPGLPGRPPPPAASVPGADGRSMDQLVAELGQRLAQRPDDARGWALYARSLAAVGRMAEAGPAYARAAALDPDNAELQSRLGEALSFAASGTITPEARAAFERALSLEPKEPRARYYLGLADRQAGKLKAAFDRWLALEAESAPDAPWRALLKERIEALAAALGIDPQVLADLRAKAGVAAPQPAPSAEAPAAPPPGPGAADVEAAQSMSPAERTEMIRGMVGRLAERMKETPDDAAGWERLARSYQVLGEETKRIGALGQIARLRPDDLAAQGDYARALAATLKPDDRVPPELAAVADRILAMDPGQPGALYFSGLARAQAGDAAGARARWEKLLSIAPADAPIVPEIRRRLDALEPPAR